MFGLGLGLRPSVCQMRSLQELCVGMLILPRATPWRVLVKVALRPVVLVALEPLHQLGDEPARLVRIGLLCLPGCWLWVLGLLPLLLLTLLKLFLLLGPFLRPCRPLVFLRPEAPQPLLLPVLSELGERRQLLLIPLLRFLIAPILLMRDTVIVACVVGHPMLMLPCGLVQIRSGFKLSDIGVLAKESRCRAVCLSLPLDISQVGCEECHGYSGCCHVSFHCLAAEGAEHSAWHLVVIVCSWILTSSRTAVADVSTGVFGAAASPSLQMPAPKGAWLGLLSQDRFSVHGWGARGLRRMRDACKFGISSSGLRTCYVVAKFL